MPVKHTVRQGECLSAIAARYGFSDYRKLYQHPDNAEFRRKRPNPNRIYPGDVLTIPDSEAKAVPIQAGKTHKFVLRSPEVMLNLQLRDANGKALGGKKFQVQAPSYTFRGTTSGDGRVECNLPLRITEAQLTVWFTDDEAGPGQVWTLDLGHLEAPDSLAGVRQRLANLGYLVGDSTGDELDEAFGFALRAFQEDHSLKPTGQLDDSTQDKLVEVHGAV